MHQEKGFDLASPGNPFIDGIDRLSNFSDTDAFFFHEHPSNDIGSHSLKLPKALKFGVTDRSEDCAAGMYSFSYWFLHLYKWKKTSFHDPEQVQGEFRKMGMHTRSDK